VHRGHAIPYRYVRISARIGTNSRRGRPFEKGCRHVGGLLLGGGSTLEEKRFRFRIRHVRRGVRLRLRRASTAHQVSSGVRQFARRVATLATVAGLRAPMTAPVTQSRIRLFREHRKAVSAVVAVGGVAPMVRPSDANWRRESSRPRSEAIDRPIRRLESKPLRRWISTLRPRRYKERERHGEWVPRRGRAVSARHRPIVHRSRNALLAGTAFFGGQ